MIEIVFFVPIILSVHVIGHKIFELFEISATGLENFIFSAMFGLLFYTYITFLLGIAGYLYAWIFWVIIAISLLFGYMIWTSLLKNIFAFVKTIKLGLNFGAFLKVAIFVFIILGLLSTLTPPFLWDELHYQLAQPKIWARHHMLVPLYSLWISELPSNVNMLYTLGLVLKNAILSKFFALSYGLLLAASIYSFGKKFYNERVSLLAAAIFLTLPMILNHIGSAYVDISVACMVFLALYCFITWLNKKDTKWLYLSAIFTGSSAASKHTAIFPTAVLFIFLLYFLKKEKLLTQSIKKLLIFGFIVFLFVAPWYLKSYLRTGNPIWPMGYSILGGKYWDSNLASEFSKDLSISKNLGIDYFLLLPWNITMHSSSFTMLLGWNAIFLAFVPLLIFFKKIEKTILMLLVHSVLLLYIIIYFSYYIFGLQILRYVMIYPALSLISATVIDYLVYAKYKKLLIFLLLVTFVFSGVLWAGVYLQKMPYVFGLEDEQAFYSKLTDNNGYNIFHYINTKLAKGSVIFLFRETRGFLSDKDYIVGLPSDQKIVDYERIKNEEDFHNELKKNNVTHILINTNIEFFEPQETVTKRQLPFSKLQQEIMDRLLEKEATLLIEDKGVYLYELR